MDGGDQLQEALQYTNAQALKVNRLEQNLKRIAEVIRCKGNPRYIFKELDKKSIGAFTFA